MLDRLMLAEFRRSLRLRLTTRLRGDMDVRRLRRAGATVGERVFIGAGALVDSDFAFLIDIGSGVRIAPRAVVLAHDASTKNTLGKTRLARVRIGDGAFIGAGAIVLPGSDIGEGAVIGAGAVVRGVVLPGRLVAGNPAREINDHEAFMARHREGIEQGPVWPRPGWTSTTGVTPERVQIMRRELADREGYID
jgi:maltose O-acetyltransferase